MMAVLAEYGKKDIIRLLHTGSRNAGCGRVCGWPLAVARRERRMKEKLH